MNGLVVVDLVLGLRTPEQSQPALAADMMIVMERSVRLTAVVTREGDWYVARALEVEVASQGSSTDEALANLTEALELYFEDVAVPPTAVSGPIVAPVEVRLSA